MKTFKRALRGTCQYVSKVTLTYLGPVRFPDWHKVGWETWLIRGQRAAAGREDPSLGRESVGSIIFNKGKHFDGNVSNMGKYFELRLEAGANRNLAELSIWHIWIIYTTRGGGDHYWLYPTWHSTSSDLPGKQCYQNIDKSFILVFKVKKIISKKCRLYQYFTKHKITFSVSARVAKWQIIYRKNLKIGFHPPRAYGLRAQKSLRVLRRCLD